MIDKKRFVEMAKKGLTTSEIAKAMGITEGVASSAACRWNVRCPVIRPYSIEGIIARRMQLELMGYSQQEIDTMRPLVETTEAEKRQQKSEARQKACREGHFAKVKQEKLGGLGTYTVIHDRKRAEAIAKAAIAETLAVVKERNPIMCARW